MKNEQLVKKIIFIFVIITLSTMLVSCQAVGAAIGAFFTFVFFAILALVGLIGVLYFSISDVSDDFLWVSILGLWVFVFSLSKLIGFAPRPLLVIAVIVQLIILLVKFISDYDYEFIDVINKVVTVWLVTASTLCSLAYVFGFLSTNIITLPFYSLALTITPAILVLLSCIIAIIPVILVAEIDRKWLHSLFVIFPLIGLVFASIMGSSFWWIVLGLGAGFILFIICVIIENKYQENILAEYEYQQSLIDERERKQKAERRRELKEERERKRLEEERKERRRQKKLEEYERNRPIKEKIEELEAEAKEHFNENKNEIIIANDIYSQLKKQYRNATPDKLYKKYLNIKGGDEVFNQNFKESDFIYEDMEEVRERLDSLYEIYKYFVSWYNIQVKEAQLENEKLSFHRKKAHLFIQRLGDIYDKLTDKTKVRSVEDAAKKLNINLDIVNLQDELKKYDKIDKNFIVNYTRTNKNFNYEQIRVVKDTFSEVWDDLGTLSGMNLSKDQMGAAGLVLGAKVLSIPFKLIGGGIKNYIEKKEQEKKYKEKIERQVNKLHKKIAFIFNEYPRTKAFSLQTNMLNMPLEKALKAYEKKFIEVYNKIFPEGDATKSKKAREKNAKNGKYFYSKEEEDSVRALHAVGKFLNELVNIKLIGE